MSSRPTRTLTTGSDGGQRDMLWLNKAACFDKDVPDFFVEAGHVITEESLNTCRGCPVRRECVIHAYTGGPAGPIIGGYYGGMSPGQRRDMTLEEALAFIEKDPPRPVRTAG